jgi:hypothetical protein
MGQGNLNTAISSFLLFGILEDQITEGTDKGTSRNIRSRDSVPPPGRTRRHASRTWHLQRLYCTTEDVFLGLTRASIAAAIIVSALDLG